MGDTTLPEADFVAANPGPLRLRVRLPEDKGGETIEVEVGGVADTVGALKKALSERVGMPVNKQKITHGSAGVLRDNLTFAKYNIGAGAELDLALKTRGGR